MPTLTSLHAAATLFALTLTPTGAQADCIDDAAARHRVNGLVLRAIGWQESRLRPTALGRNANGTIDVGAFQINSIHLSELGRYGIDRQALQDGCVSADVAAWHYRRQVDLRGDTWQAVGDYHSRTAARGAWYANQVAATLMRWRVMPPGPLPFPFATAPPSPPVPGVVPPLAAPRLPPRLPSRAPRPAAGEAAPVRAAPSPAVPVLFDELAYLPPAR